ncbi:hypothetical protein [Rhizobium changzhiense]|uniref:hypothetical protein n=1 Tax=Rhizobium changzhiense TaxID=2692317 RepID=UPI001FED92C3|nr:hypothetical protein [Rhizobium changzhiense]
MIDHITIAMSDLEKSKLFCERAFEPLGYRLSFGKEGVFWAFDVGGSLFEIQHTDDRPPLTRLHVAFRVQSRAEVEAFYRAALEAGARPRIDRPATALIDHQGVDRNQISLVPATRPVGCRSCGRKRG